jgi:hypothetical protein
VVRTRAPDAAGALDGERLDSGGTPQSIERSLQVIGTWAQLLSIAELHDVMRARRSLETEQGFEHLTGTFANVIAAWREGGVAADAVRELLAKLRVSPTLTAHPTEAKRVTVLEKHKSIYRRLVELDAVRWTRRERELLIEGIRNEIEILWMTGELRLEKPTVAQEVAWGLHFFNTTLFNAIWVLHDDLEHGVPAALRASVGRAATRAQPLGARVARATGVSPGARTRAGGVRGRRAHRGTQPRRALSAVALVHAAQAGGDHRRVIGGRPRDARGALRDRR